MYISHRSATSSQKGSALVHLLKQKVNVFSSARTSPPQQPPYPLPLPNNPHGANRYAIIYMQIKICIYIYI